MAGISILINNFKAAIPLPVTPEPQECKPVTLSDSKLVLENEALKAEQSKRNSLISSQKVHNMHSGFPGNNYVFILAHQDPPVIGKWGSQTIRGSQSSLRKDSKSRISDPSLSKNRSQRSLQSIGSKSLHSIKGSKLSVSAESPRDSQNRA